MAWYHVFDPFTEILKGYGRRIEENFYDWDGCCGKMSTINTSEGRRVYGECMVLYRIPMSNGSLHNSAIIYNWSNQMDGAEVIRGQSARPLCIISIVSIPRGPSGSFYSLRSPYVES